MIGDQKFIPNKKKKKQCKEKLLKKLLIDHCNRRRFGFADVFVLETNIISNKKFCFFEEKKFQKNRIFF